MSDANHEHSCIVPHEQHNGRSCRCVCGAIRRFDGEYHGEWSDTGDDA